MIYIILSTLEGFFCKGRAYGEDCDIKCRPHVIIENGKQYLLPYLEKNRRRGWGVVRCMLGGGVMLQRTRRDFYCCGLFSNNNNFFDVPYLLKREHSESYHKLACVMS